VAKGLTFEEQCLEKSKLDGLLKSFYANVSGQKSEASIRSYSRRLSEEKQRDISNSFSHYCGFPSHAMNDIPSLPNPESEPAVKVPRSVTDSSSSSIEIPSQKYRSALDTVLHSPLPCSSLAVFVCSEQLFAEKTLRKTRLFHSSREHLRTVM
jgi:hypothetical protein